MDLDLEWQQKAEEQYFQEEEQRVVRNFVFNTIKSNKEISELFNSGTFWSSYALNIIYKASGQQRVAFIAGKKIGKAYKRNFLKRRLRHLYLNNIDLFQDMDVLLIAKQNLLEGNFYRINKNLKNFKCQK